MTGVRLCPDLEASQQDDQWYPFPPSWSRNCLPDRQSSHSTKWYVNLPNLAKELMALMDDRRTSESWSRSSPTRRTRTSVSIILDRISSAGSSASYSAKRYVDLPNSAKAVMISTDDWRAPELESWSKPKRRVKTAGFTALDRKSSAGISVLAQYKMIHQPTEFYQGTNGFDR